MYINLQRVQCMFQCVCSALEVEHNRAQRIAGDQSIADRGSLAHSQTGHAGLPGREIMLRQARVSPTEREIQRKAARVFVEVSDQLVDARQNGLEFFVRPINAASRHCGESRANVRRDLRTPDTRLSHNEAHPAFLKRPSTSRFTPCRKPLKKLSAPSVQESRPVGALGILGRSSKKT
jgi:hypothetical protein